jgi:hypothetical protein
MSPARPPKGPDVVSLSDIAAMPEIQGKGRTYAQWVMDREVHPQAPEGTQTAAGMIWHRPEVVAFLKAWKPRKGPQDECDLGHPMVVSPSGRRYCPTCDVHRHLDQRDRDRAAALTFPCNDCKAGTGQPCFKPAPAGSGKPPRSLLAPHKARLERVKAGRKAGYQP